MIQGAVGSLVSTDWLQEHLQDVRVVDIRGHVLPASVPPPHYFNHRGDYEVSHIPGAVFVDWVHEITDPADPRHARIAPPERFADLMGHCGISRDTVVVAYDDAAGMFAARLWWALRYYGHQAVAVLNGGWQKWISEGRPTTAEVPVIVSTTFTSQVHTPLMVTADQVLPAVEAGRVLVDVRTPQEFTGEASRAARRGHIPGAVNVPRSDLIDSEGMLLPPDQLRVRFAQAGITQPDVPVMTYCNGGVSASYGLLALEAAGFSGSVYDGSWKEWGNDEARPITR